MPLGASGTWSRACGRRTTSVIATGVVPGLSDHRGSPHGGRDSRGTTLTAITLRLTTDRLRSPVEALIHGRS
jgi:hypothetical protein